MVKSHSHDGVGNFFHYRWIMPIEVTLPRVTQTAEKASITKWLKKEGDWVEKGEALFEMETDKATVEVESPGSGTLGQIVLSENELMPVGALAAFLFAKGEEVRKREVPATAAAPGPTAPAEAKSEIKAEGPMAVDREVLATPLAKRMARELGIDIRAIRGSGPGGRIEKMDVERAKPQGPAPAPTPSAQPGLLKLTATREAIARRMSQSFATAPHFYLSLEADMKALQETREALGKRGSKPTFTDLIVFIVAKALREFPKVNASWTEGGILVKEEINIGVAAEAESGLIVPVLKRADQRSLPQISEALASLVQKARAKKLGVEDLTGGTFTITNMGMLGIERFDAIINPPESAILSTGKIVEKVVVIDGGIHIRPRMDLTLSVDHRVLDGADGARFLVRIKEMIENPQSAGL